LEVQAFLAAGLVVLLRILLPQEQQEEADFLL
jgi:hypothetical protein